MQVGERGRCAGLGLGLARAARERGEGGRAGEEKGGRERSGPDERARRRKTSERPGERRAAQGGGCWLARRCSGRAGLAERGFYGTGEGVGEGVGGREGAGGGPRLGSMAAQRYWVDGIAAREEHGTGGGGEGGARVGCGCGSQLGMFCAVGGPGQESVAYERFLQAASARRSRALEGRPRRRRGTSGRLAGRWGSGPERAHEAWR